MGNLFTPISCEQCFSLSPRTESNFEHMSHCKCWFQEFTFVTWIWCWKRLLRVPWTVTKTRPGADCGSDHELLIAKISLKLMKVGKTTRLFRYDLNQIPYDYTVEVRNRFKGLDLIECLMNYGWRFMTLYRRQESRPSRRKRNAKKQNGYLRRP